MGMIYTTNPDPAKYHCESMPVNGGSFQEYYDGVFYDSGLIFTVSRASVSAMSRPAHTPHAIDMCFLVTKCVACGSVVAIQYIVPDSPKTGQLHKLGPNQRSALQGRERPRRCRWPADGRGTMTSTSFLPTGSSLGSTITAATAL